MTFRQLIGFKNSSEGKVGHVGGWADFAETSFTRPFKTMTLLLQAGLWRDANGSGIVVLLPPLGARVPRGNLHVSPECITKGSRC